MGKIKVVLVLVAVILVGTLWYMDYQTRIRLHEAYKEFRKANEPLEEWMKSLEDEGVVKRCKVCGNYVD